MKITQFIKLYNNALVKWHTSGVGFKRGNNKYRGRNIAQVTGKRRRQELRGI